MADVDILSIVSVHFIETRSLIYFNRDLSLFRGKISNKFLSQNNNAADNTFFVTYNRSTFELLGAANSLSC